LFLNPVDISGLGVGVTAKSFYKLGINVSVVEIDPVVHRFAEKYFGLRNVLVLHEDGRDFVKRSARKGEKWDYILHDVFTGGSFPAHLFTTEMWALTKDILYDDGVLAVVTSHSLR
jgi:spermidine synthase